MRSLFISRSNLSFNTRITGCVLALVQICTAPPAMMFAAGAPEKRTTKTTPAKKLPLPPDPTAGTKINRTLPTVQAPTQTLRFSASPTDAELGSARIFAEPLIPIGGKTDKIDNENLAAALTAFAAAANAERTEPLTRFLDTFPDTPWRASLLANLGALYRSTGYWSKCLEAWENAWSLLANESTGPGKVMGDYVLGELVKMNARLGRFDRLQELFSQIAGRDVRGPATEKVAGARQGLALMQNRPEDAFRCGPMALERILFATKKSPGVNQAILESRSTTQGMSLVQVNELARTLGMDYQMAKRTPGAQVIFPSVVNWKVGHFAALIKEEKSRFLSQDPTFTDDVWVSTQALDEEGSGYYLVPNGALPSGWQPVGAEEGARVWGKGNAGANPDTPPPCVAPMVGCGCDGERGMPGYNVNLSSVSLSIGDTPLSYSPPKGPAVAFTVSYTQREVAPVSFPTYSNLGNKWSFKWLSYIVVDPNVEVADAIGYGPGGGTLNYKGFNTTTQKYAPQLETQTALVKTGPTTYEKRTGDGSYQVFGISDGAPSYPRKIFMTQSVDPHGNALTYTYDASFRLVAVSDALGQVTTLSYELAADPLKITKVTDPFGRTATLQYNAAGQLWKITDSVGMVSEFTYGAGDFISKMTTPYGDTHFSMGESGSDYRFLEVTDPEGGTERVEYNNAGNSMPGSDPVLPAGMNLANSWLNYRNTYYWDKKAMQEGAGIYSKARVYHWLHASDLNVASDVISSTKLPLEGRVWNEYSTGTTISAGASNQPSKVGRVLDDGTTQLYQYEYNELGRTTKVTDPMGRVTTYVYDTNNVDLLEVRQQTAGINELLAKHTYNSQHLPLTAKDAAGQTMTLTYNAAGQLKTITNAKSEVTTYNYDSNGYLQNIVGALPGATTSFTYDGFGRLRTTTDSQDYTVVIEYDATGGDATKTLDRIAKIIYPDETYEQITYDRMDAEWTRDRLGRWSRKFYDSMRNIVATQDPLNQMVIYHWCGCGSLEGVTDAGGNTTSWTRDIQGRLVNKTLRDGTNIQYSYENKTSRLKTVTDAQGQITNYAYFNDDNIKQISYSNALYPTPVVAYTYDSKYNRLATMTDANGVTAYSYKAITVPPAIGAGRLSAVDGPFANDAITYLYDGLGRITGRSINGAANESSVLFDPLGRVQSATNALGTFTYAYVSTTGHLDRITFPNSQKTQYSYFDNAGDIRLKQIKNLNGSNDVISQFDYTYSPLGHITKWSLSNSGPSNDQHYALRYDAGGQLRQAMLRDSVAETTLHQYQYDYDSRGNRATTQVDSTVTTSASNDLNQITGQSGGGNMHFVGRVDEPATVSIAGDDATVDAQGNFEGAAAVTEGTNTVPIVATDGSGNSSVSNYQVTIPTGQTIDRVYDLNGNITNDGAKSYEWDAANRLVAINYPTENPVRRTEFGYDGYSRLVKTTEKTGETVDSTKTFLWVGKNIVEERDATGAIVTKKFPGGGFVVDGNKYFFFTDHLGSVREVLDNGGNLRGRFDYDLWGTRTQASGDVGSDFGFTGHYYHTRSGLIQTPYRFYDSTTGTWLNRDPSGEQSGLNLYAYVGNNPVSSWDPLGLQVAPPPVWGGPYLNSPAGLGGTAGPAAGGGAVTTVGAVVLPILAVAAWTPAGQRFIINHIVDPWLDILMPMPQAQGPQNSRGPNGTLPESPLPEGSKDPVRYPAVNPGRGPGRGGGCGDCLPCPPNSPAWEVNEPGHGGGQSHWHWIEYNQNPNTCECRPVRRSSPTKPSGA